MGLRDKRIAALSRVYRLQVLCRQQRQNRDTGHSRACENYTRLRRSKLGDAALAEATQLVMLDASRNRHVTTIAPFGGTLIELHAEGNCGIGGAVGFPSATNLVSLHAGGNPRIESVAPFASSLLELDARTTDIDDAALFQLTNLVWINCSFNEQITTVAPFAQSLRHVVADCGSSLRDAGLSNATNLVTLYCYKNPNITTIAFCQNSLLIADCGMEGDEIANAPQLRKVTKRKDDKISLHHLKGFTQINDSVFAR